MPLDARRLAGSAHLHPLEDFFRREQRPLPAIEMVDADSVPEPFNTLLVHGGAMTHTLEAFHGQRLDLRVLHRWQSGDLYLRHIVLCRQGDGVPVEFGSITIDLARFTPALRELIVAEKAPLGRLLEEHKVPHASRPRAFFRIEPDPLLAAVLQIDSTRPLHGRCNALIDPDQQPLAEIVEILPPVRR